MNDLYLDFADECRSISHHGVQGQKWGVRRYQNSDGSLTDEGKKRYSKSGRKKDGKLKKAIKETVREYKKDNSVENQVARKRAEFDNWADNEIQKEKRSKKDKTFMGSYSEAYGVGARRTEAENKAKYYDKVADTYSNKSKQREYRTLAENERYKAEYFDKRAQNYSKGLWKATQQAGRDFVYGEQDIKNMKYRTASGKLSTRGEEYSKRILWETLATTAVDLALDSYVDNRGKKNDPNYKSQNKSAVDHLIENSARAEINARREYLNV